AGVGLEQREAVGEAHLGIGAARDAVGVAGIARDGVERRHLRRDELLEGRRAEIPAARGPERDAFRDAPLETRAPEVLRAGERVVDVAIRARELEYLDQR